MRIAIISALSIGSCLFAQNPPAWVARSNQNVQLLIAINAKYGPEGASQLGVPGLDEQISVPTAERFRQMRADIAKARAELEARFAAEKDPLVRQDLQILVAAADRDIRAMDAREKTFLPYQNIANLVFFGTKGLLDDQVKQERRPAAVV